MPRGDCVLQRRGWQWWASVRSATPRSTVRRRAATISSPTDRCPRALVLTPTRELAAQIADSARLYGKYVAVRTTVVFGLRFAVLLGVEGGKSGNDNLSLVDIKQAAVGRGGDLARATRSAGKAGPDAR